MKFRKMLLAACAYSAIGSAVMGESVLPPATYGKSSYVDPRGCEYGRAMIGGWQVWVQRLDDDGQPICGLEPTQLRSRETVPSVPKGRT